MTTRKRINNHVREGSRLATAIIYSLAFLVILICVYPMYYVFINSISEKSAVLAMQVNYLPVGFSLDAYKTLAQNAEIWRALRNTLVYVVANTVLMLFSSTIMAYPLTFKSLMGRKYVNMYLLVTMFFSGGLIPTFLLILRLGLYDSPWALIIPGSVSVWNIILVKSYLSTIPETLREAARIDGANVYQMLTSIYLPLAVPILAVIAVYTVVGTWNSWFSALVYLPHADWQPLQVFLRRLLVLDETLAEAAAEDATVALEAAYRQLARAQLKYAVIIFSSLPVLCTYPFFQKYFMKGIMLGSLKE